MPSPKCFCCSRDAVKFDRQIGECRRCLHSMSFSKRKVDKPQETSNLATRRSKGVEMKPVSAEQEDKATQRYAEKFPGYDYIEEAPDGEYVKFEAHDILKQRVEGLEKALREIIGEELSGEINTYVPDDAPVHSFHVSFGMLRRARKTLKEGDSQ